jgi:hypothetical protein
MEAITMRRLLISFTALPILVLALAAPAAAAPPLRESGTQASFFSFNTICSGATCTDTYVDAFNIDSETLVVCLSSYTYNVHTGRLVSQESGCIETSPEALTISSDFTVTLAETAITLFDCNRHACTEGDTLTVSAQDSAVGPVFTDSGRGTSSDGTCTYRYSFSSESAEVAGTMTIDGVTLEQSGFASISQFTVSSRCR